LIEASFCIGFSRLLTTTEDKLIEADFEYVGYGEKDKVAKYHKRK